jgi:hypothetical protein
VPGRRRQRRGDCVHRRPPTACRRRLPARPEPEGQRPAQRAAEQDRLAVNYTWTSIRVADRQHLLLLARQHLRHAVQALVQQGADLGSGGRRFLWKDAKGKYESSPM